MRHTPSTGPTSSNGNASIHVGNLDEQWHAPKTKTFEKKRSTNFPRTFSTMGNMSVTSSPSAPSRDTMWSAQSSRAVGSSALPKQAGEHASRHVSKKHAFEGKYPGWCERRTSLKCIVAYGLCGCFDGAVRSRELRTYTASLPLGMPTGEEGTNAAAGQGVGPPTHQRNV